MCWIAFAPEMPSGHSPGFRNSGEFRKGEPFTGPHRERQVGMAKQLFAAMGIAGDDAERRQDWLLRGFRQFDAPVYVILPMTHIGRER